MRNASLCGPMIATTNSTEEDHNDLGHNIRALCMNGSSAHPTGDSLPGELA